MSTDKLKVVTNLEKKTKEKIAKMTDDTDTMDFVLKNLKLIKRIKRCRVRLCKVSGKNLMTKKHIGPGKSKPKKIGQKKDKPNEKVKKLKKGISSKGTKKNVLTDNSSPGSKAKANEEVKKVKKRKSSDNKSKDDPTKSGKTPGRKKKSTTEKDADESESPGSPRSKKKKESPTGSTEKVKNQKKKRQIFIRLPFMERARMRCLSKILLEKSKEKKKDKKNAPIKRLGRTYLTKKFGSKLFRCHVKVLRYRDPNNPTPRKKDKGNRKSVSFLETVEIFGESDDDDMHSSHNSTPAQELQEEVNSVISLNSDESNSGSPRRRKISSLKSSDTPRSERMKKSDEKIPSLQSERDSIIESSQLIENSDELEVLDEVKEVNSENTLSNKEEQNLEQDSIKLSNDKEDSVKLSDDEADEQKKRNTIPISDINVDKNNSKDDNQKKLKSYEENEQFIETCIDENNVDISNTENHTEPPLNGKTTINSEPNSSSPQTDLFSDAEDHFEEDSVRNLQLSFSSEKSNNETEETRLKTNSQLDNEKLASDTTPPQQTKFSLNTFFKSLKTKIIPEDKQTASPNKGNQQMELDDDNTLRSELTIK